MGEEVVTLSLSNSGNISEAQQDLVKTAGKAKSPTPAGWKGAVAFKAGAKEGEEAIAKKYVIAPEVGILAKGETCEVTFTRKAGCPLQDGDGFLLSCIRTQAANAATIQWKGAELNDIDTYALANPE